MDRCEASHESAVEDRPGEVQRRAGRIEDVIHNAGIIHAGLMQGCVRGVTFEGIERVGVA